MIGKKLQIVRHKQDLPYYNLQLAYFKAFFLKIIALSTICSQERLVINCGL